MVQKFYVLLRYGIPGGKFNTDELKVWAKNHTRAIELAKKKWCRHFADNPLYLYSTAVSSKPFQTFEMNNINIYTPEFWLEIQKEHLEFNFDYLCNCKLFKRTWNAKLESGEHVFLPKIVDLAYDFLEENPSDLFWSQAHYNMAHSPEEGIIELLFMCKNFDVSYVEIQDVRRRFVQYCINKFDI